ncbi:hypothetical protein [Tunturiibacter gelidoferens]|uniref:Uncharacterized protein n=1 Tax=Tunturiibacter gelidiferens TaxID=3069689 RepID=A0A9X0QHL4_9BACT|nr:hypothetical protein [Edaphobacter lichenicola]MBB5330439.1 hypothetical protein [Edaphobacter lichenicola]
MDRINRCEPVIEAEYGKLKRRTKPTLGFNSMKLTPSWDAYVE